MPPRLNRVSESRRVSTLLSSNHVGDILTDLIAGVPGSIGLAASANINPTKKFPRSLFEPFTCSDPGQSPAVLSRTALAAILSARHVFLLHLVLATRARGPSRAASQRCCEGRVRTPTSASSATTTQWGTRVGALANQESNHRDTEHRERKRKSSFKDHALLWFSLCLCVSVVNSSSS